jgi:hypothetical protein
VPAGAGIRRAGPAAVSGGHAPGSLLPGPFGMNAGHCLTWVNAGISGAVTHVDGEE